MPKRHREGIDKQQPVNVAAGQVWEHRWQHNQATVVSADFGLETALMAHAKRVTSITWDMLFRDYILVDA